MWSKNFEMCINLENKLLNTRINIDINTVFIINGIRLHKGT